MRVIPVLDLLGGKVVRGIGGRRDEYQPIVSQLTRSCYPRDVARAVIEYFGLQHFYVADLDAIERQGTNRSRIDELLGQGVSIWLDSGFRTVSDLQPWLDIPGVDPVIGSETWDGDSELVRLRADGALPNVVFSLDMRDGVPLARSKGWVRQSPVAVVQCVRENGIERIILLDIARVGTYRGPLDDDLCRSLVTGFPGIEFYIGGGVRGVGDLIRAGELGLRGSLVASALHDGRLSPGDIERVCR